MTTIQLKEAVKKLPRQPGIYVFKNSQNNPLYIGKALDLRNRVGHYLKTNDVRLQRMVGVAKKLRHIQTKSDIEALILESQLIKKFRPQFNIAMRDDKQYFYVGFSNENFPKIFITHQPRTSGACPSSPRTGSVLLDLHATGVPTRATPRLFSTHFIGPFTDGNALKMTLRFLRSIFPYCTCSKLHHNYCLNYHIGKCLGFCCLKNQKWITDLRSRLSTGLFNQTTYKKNITAIKMVLAGKKKSIIKNLEKEMVRSAKKGNLERAIELRGKLWRLKRVFENAKIIHNSKFLIHNSKSTVKKLVVLKEFTKVLKLNKAPHRIEGYDVSNIHGTHATGSMVTFVHGQPNKNFYRKFKIRRILSSETHGERGFGDVQMLAQILKRRFRHDEWPFPDLVLIDGGKGQVNEAIKTLKKLAIKIPVIGISKNERHIGHQLIVPGRKAPLPLTKLSPADKNLLLQIDSEAHRFAIGYYRKLHRKLYRQ